MSVASPAVFLPTLPGRYYTDSVIFEQEMRDIFSRQWVYAGRAEDVPVAGRFVRVPIGNENVIVVRGRDQELRAFLNVCRHRGATLCTADSGEVVEIDPPRKLVLKWQNHLFPDLTAEGFSRMTYELEQKGDSVKLTVTHGMEKSDSEFIRKVSGGWPGILASLKSLLETGKSLEMTRHWPEGM